MASIKKVSITVELTDDQALAFSQFLKRACFSDYHGCAVDEDEAYTMIHASEKIREALAGVGYAPR
jgi:hypothetical protein